MKVAYEIVSAVNMKSPSHSRGCRCISVISHVVRLKNRWIETAMALSFNGHTVVVTGAAGGLGKAYAVPICDMSKLITGLQLLAVVRVAGG